MKIVISDSNGCYEVELEKGAFFTIVPETRNEYDAMAICGAQYHPLIMKADDEDRNIGFDDKRPGDDAKLKEFEEAMDWHFEIIGRTSDDREIEKEMHQRSTFLLLKRSDWVTQRIICMPDSEDEENTPSPVRIMAEAEHADFLRGFINVGVAAAMDEDFMGRLKVVEV